MYDDINDASLLLDLPEAGDVLVDGALLRKGPNADPIKNLGNNQWARLYPNREPAGRSYSGIHYGNGKILYFGGGHGSYAGNDVEIYDIATNTWARQYPPEFWTDHLSTLARKEIDTNGVPGWATIPDGYEIDGSPTDNGKIEFLVEKSTKRIELWERATGKHLPITPEIASVRAIGGGASSGLLSPMGRPHTLHTYQMIVWDPTKNKWMARLRGPGDFAFNPSTKSWELLQNANPPYGGDVHCHSVFYDPDVGFISVVLGPAGVYKLQGTTWTRIGEPLDRSWRAPYSAYIADRKYHVFAFVGDDGTFFYKYDAVGNQWTAMTVPAALKSLDSFDYDTRNNVLIGVQHDWIGFRVWKFDPANDQWSELSVPSVRPNQTTGAQAMGPILRYDPIHNIFIFLKGSVGDHSGGRETETWAYRYKGNTGGAPSLQ
jgi:hypothetical protein